MIVTMPKLFKELEKKPYMKWNDGRPQLIYVWALPLGVVVQDTKKKETSYRIDWPIPQMLEETKWNGASVKEVIETVKKHGKKIPNLDMIESYGRYVDCQKDPDVGTFAIYRTRFIEKKEHEPLHVISV